MDTTFAQQFTATYGGITCDCSPEKNHHLPMPISPAGSCPHCGKEGPLYRQALERAKVNGRGSDSLRNRGHSAEIIEFPEPYTEPWWEDKKFTGGENPHDDDGQVNPLLDEHGFVNWHAAFKAQPEQVQWIIEPVIEAGRLHSIFGPAQAGKTLVSMELCCKVIDRGMTALYVDNENGIQEWVERLTAFGRTPDNLAGLYCLPYSSMPALDTPEGGRELLRLAQVAGADVVWIDTTSRFIRGRENDSDTFIAVYSHSLMPLKRNGIAVVRLDHTGKDEDRGQRGSSAKDQDLDFIWRIQSDGKLTRTITCEKSRSFRPLKKGDKITLRVHEVTPDNPTLFHEWDYEISSEEDSQVAADVKTLDSLGLPPDAGKRTAREAITKAGIMMGNPRLEAALRARKNVQGTLFDVPTNVPTGI